MAKRAKNPIKTPYRKQQGHKWYVYVMVTFVSLCLMLVALLAAMYIMDGGQKSIGEILGGIITRGGKDQGEEPDGIIPKREDFNILVAGLDVDTGQQRSDSIMVGHVSMKNDYANFVFIPRDTRVPIAGRRGGKEKINYAYGAGGLPMMRNTIEQLFDINVNYYLLFNVEGFINVIDAVGGLEVDVEKNMRYTDRSQNLFINLKKGKQHLSGDQVMQYSRFRHDSRGDFGRIERQQKILHLLSKKMLSRTLLKKGPDILNALEKQQTTQGNHTSPLVYTDLTSDDLIMLASFYNQNVSRNINTYTVPGNVRMINEISYVIPDYSEMPYLVGGALKGGYHPDNKQIKIQVLNGCRSGGIAEVYGRRLEYYGFDIVHEGNADNFDYKTTEVHLHRDTPFAEAVARLLNADLVDAPDVTSTADITVIIGLDKLKNP